MLDHCASDDPAYRADRESRAASEGRRKCDKRYDS
jgi:hypothetical protein